VIVSEISTESRFSSARILVVDNEASNVRTLSRILHAAGYTNVVATTDPTKVLTLFAEQEPDLVLLDLHMPVLDGVAVLEHLAEVAAPHSYLPVLVLTGDSSQQARRRALSKGAKDFVTKPFEVDEVLLRIRNLLETKYLHREIAAENVLLEQRVKERTVDLEGAHLDTLERLAVAAEFRDDDTGRHTERVAASSALLGRVAGLDGEAVELLRRAAPLHDLGKIGIPDVILRKPGPLTPDEWEIMKTHTTAGARILGGGKSRVMRLAEEIALSHHERWDGTGYPEARAGEAIPLVARVVAVADVFDALTSDRVYRKAWASEDALAHIQGQAGSHFDPAVARLCAQPLVWQGLLAVRDG
jgi:putative two-component system response regulator